MLGDSNNTIHLMSNGMTSCKLNLKWSVLFAQQMGSLFFLFHTCCTSLQQFATVVCSHYAQMFRAELSYTADTHLTSTHSLDFYEWTETGGLQSANR